MIHRTKRIAAPELAFQSYSATIAKPERQQQQLPLMPRLQLLLFFGLW
jgi:hypothetical protein